MWFRAAVAIGIFLEQYECVAFDYQVEVLGILGILGTGSLAEQEYLVGGGVGTDIT